ncbi:MAG: 50S ribosomal protein L11 methyltransferase [Gammaproteobacteria bacterium]
MPWIKLEFACGPADAHALGDALSEAGAAAVTLVDGGDQPVLEPAPGEVRLWDDTRVVGLFEADTDIAPVLAQMGTLLGAPPPAHRVEALEDRDWVRAWMDDYKPMSFGERLWIVPWHSEPPNPEAVNLRLDPGLAFGTGTHPTTALCLRWLDREDCARERVLDFGCGSGILGIAALLLGADHVDAVDIDPQALQATRDNALRNGVADRIAACAPDATPPEPADRVLANILAKPLIELAPLLAAHCRVGGRIVLSGLLDSQVESVRPCYEPWFDMDPPEILDGWARLSGRRRPA